MKNNKKKKQQQQQTNEEQQLKTGLTYLYLPTNVHLREQNS